MTSTQVPTYFATKSFLLSSLQPLGLVADENDIKLHLLSSIASAVVAAVVTQPADVVKTRLMNMQPSAAGGVGEYASPVDCVVRVARTEGLGGFYKGLGATLARLLPHTMVLWTVQEQDLVLQLWFKSPH